MLTGRLHCPRCNKAMVGTRATGRSRSYRYYICGNVSRFNSAKCDFPRMDADAIDTAILDALTTFYRTQHTIIDAAIDNARRVHRTAHADRRAELSAISAELTKTNHAIERYLAAFESALGDELLAERLSSLRTKSNQLQTRRDELTYEMEEEPCSPGPDALNGIADHIAEVTVIAPDRLIPIFRIPQPTPQDPPIAENTKTAPEGTVRIPTTSVGPTYQHTNQSVLVDGPQITIRPVRSPTPRPMLRV
ncbi:zinc ribbon domain-containing protein [Nocardia brasiliensis]|uniref:zinc ribbon domain-containing protein n=1 Tax=Nocardia brasiliensis TaxID=37326 RepID=UPI003D8EE17D